MIPILLLSDNLEEIKMLADICKKNGFMFIFVNEVDRFKSLLINENIVVAIINSKLMDNVDIFIEKVRDAGCNSSFIYVGEESFNMARKLLKSGCYDYLTVNYSKDEMEASLKDSVENVFTFEKIKSLSEDLENTNKNLLQKTDELQKEKKNLNNYIDILQKIHEYVKDIGHSHELKFIVDVTIRYLSEKFSNKIIVFTIIEDFVENVVGAFNISIDSFKDISWDLKNLNISPWGDSLLNQQMKITVEYPLKNIWYEKSSIVSFFPYGFIKYPLVSRNKVFGTITISYNPGEKLYLENEELFIYLLSEHASIALDNVLLNEELLSALEKLKKTQSQLLENEKIQTVAKFAVSINHEINNPLCSISLNIELLKRYLKDKTDANLERIIDAMEKNVEKINSITKKITNMRKIVTKEYLLGIEMIDFNEK